jgi:hypothetical protein
MTKKHKDSVAEPKNTQKSADSKSQIKKSKSAEELKPKPSPEVQALTAQLNATQEKLNSLQTRLQGHEPSLLLKARQDLIVIRQQLIQLFPKSPAKPSELLEQLIRERGEFFDHNNELRIQALKDDDALKASQRNEDKYFTQYQQAQKQLNQLKLQLAQTQKALTFTQQDLKSAQRIIELRLNEQGTKPINQPNY